MDVATPAVLTAAAGVFITVRERHYRVAGTTTRHLMEAATLMCPHRAGVRHVGYTDWQLGWSFTPREYRGRHLVAAARVELAVTRTIPRWRPTSAADRDLVSGWAELVAAITKHEQGHVNIAASGAHSLHDAVMAVTPTGSNEDLEAQVAAIVESSLDAIRATDRAYDEATQHGALQGVRLPW